MIQTFNLKKHFGAIRAVDDLSFAVEKGEVLGFLGPNGAGKSTTMKILTCFLPPTAGTAEIGGHDILKDPMAVRRTLGYLPESAPAWPEMTVQAFLQFVGRIRGYGGAELTRRIDAVIDKCALDEVRHQLFETLSKGYKRRVGLAQALIHDPPVLIMDEPTDGLDPNQKHEVRNLIKSMAKDKAIILSTHILEEVDAVCSRMVIIAHGRLLADGTPDQLRRRAPNHGTVLLAIKTDNPDETRAALGQAANVDNVVDKGALEDGCRRFKIIPKRGQTIANEIAHLLREKRWEVEEMHVEQGHLDVVFRELTRPQSGNGGGA